MDELPGAGIAMMYNGLGFFLFVMFVIIWWTGRDERREDRLERERHERRLSEAREFGFGGPNQHTVETLHPEDAKKKK